MRDLVVLVLHLLATVARLAGPGGARAVVAESVLVKQQLLILNRSRKRSPNVRPSDRVVAGLCALFMRPGRLMRSAIVFKPSTLLRLHRALTQRKYRRLFSSKGPMKPGPKGPSQEVIAAVVDMKQRNPSWGLHGSRNRSPWPSVFPSTRMWCDAFWLLGTSQNQTRRGRPGSRSLVTRRTVYGVLTVNHLGHHSHPLPIVSQWSASTSSATRPSIRAWRMMPEAAHNVASERRTECRCYDRKSQCTGGNANGFHD